MTTRTEANKAMKEEQKSFEYCVNMINSMRNLDVVKNYLQERGITVDFLTKKVNKQLACKAELFKYCNLHEFTAANGETYKAIYRKDKDGNVVEAKWSVWCVLCALDARYKAIQEADKKAKAIKEMKAKEESRAALAAELKAKKGMKKATTKKAA